MENENTSTEQDPLSAAAEGWEAPSYPCLAPDRIVQLKIGKCTKAAVKDNATRELLTITLKPVDGKEYVDTKGNPMKNFTGFHRIGITPTEATDDKRARTIKDIGADISMVLKACGMLDKSPRNLIDNPSTIDGQVVDIRVGLIPAKGQYPESNSFKFVPTA